MGAVGALVMAAAQRRLSLDLIRQALASTTRLSSFVLFILIGSRVFSLTFYGVNGHLWVEHLLISLPGGEVGFLIVVNLLVFFLAFLPQFTSPARGPVALQILQLGALFMLATLLIFGCIAFFSGLFGQHVQRSPRARRLLNRCAGVVFLGLAVKLVLSER